MERHGEARLGGHDDLLPEPEAAGDDGAQAVAIDSQNRAVVAGYSSNGSNSDFAVVRYTSAGVLDTTFGTGGKVTTAIGTSYDWGQAVAVDSQDRVVVVGDSDNAYQFWNSFLEHYLNTLFYSCVDHTTALTSTSKTYISSAVLYTFQYYITTV